MDGEEETARLRSDRRLVRMLARRYHREADLALVLRHEVKDYELADRHCRWITAGLMHRLNRLLRWHARTAPATTNPGLSVIVIRACLRGEARRYREQSGELLSGQPKSSDPVSSSSSSSSVSSSNRSGIAGGFGQC